jgi:hypothetical protein
MTKYLVAFLIIAAFCAGITFRGSLIYQQTVNYLMLQDGQKIYVGKDEHLFVKQEDAVLPGDTGGIVLPDPPPPDESLPVIITTMPPTTEEQKK